MAKARSGWRPPRTAPNDEYKTLTNVYRKHRINLKLWCSAVRVENGFDLGKPLKEILNGRGYPADIGTGEFYRDDDTNEPDDVLYENVNNPAVLPSKEKMLALEIKFLEVWHLMLIDITKEYLVIWNQDLHPTLVPLDKFDIKNPLTIDMIADIILRDVHLDEHRP